MILECVRGNILLCQLGGVGGGDSLLIRLIKLVYPVSVAMLHSLCKVKVCCVNKALAYSSDIITLISSLSSPYPRDEN